MRDVKLLPILHEIGEENTTRSKLPFKTKDLEMTHLHVFFYLKGVLVGKEYLSINYLLPLSYNIGLLPTSLNKRVIMSASLKEFLMNCIKQFIVYIWMSTPLGKMKTYLRKITKEIGIEIDPQRVIGQNLCKINKHIM